MIYSPKVSIIIPAYNLEKYISTALKSIFNQTYNNYEIIVVLDGCSDNTENIIKENFIDKRLKVISIPRSGVSIARNTGINNATGDWIAFLDGDDYWKSNFLESMISILVNSDADICYSGYEFEKAGKVIEQMGISLNYFEGNIVYDYIRGHVFVLSGSFMVKSNLLKNYKIHFTQNCALGEDTEFRIKIFSVGKAVAVKQNLLRIVIREGSATKSFNLDYFQSFENAYLRSIIFMKQNVKDASFVDMCEKEILNHIIPRRIAGLMCNASYLGCSVDTVRYAKSQGLYRKMVRFRPDSPKDGILFFYYIAMGHLGPSGKFIGPLSSKIIRSINRRFAR